MMDYQRSAIHNKIAPTDSRLFRRHEIEDAQIQPRIMRDLRDRLTKPAYGIKADQNKNKVPEVISDLNEDMAESSDAMSRS